MSAEEATMRVEEEEIPILETVQNVAEELQENTNIPAGKQSKRYAKVMAKLGAKPESNVLRVSIKSKELSFTVNTPEVYRFTGSNTFAMFGQVQLDENVFDAQKAAARAVTGEPEKLEATPAAVTVASAEETFKAETTTTVEDADAGDVNDKEITMVMTQAKVSRADAIKALKSNNGDIVNAIMELTC